MLADFKHKENQTEGFHDHGMMLPPRPESFKRKVQK